METKDPIPSADFPTQHYLREWRIERGLSQSALGRLVGVNKSVISRMETGSHGISIEMQLGLMRALDIVPNQFFAPPKVVSLDALARGASESQREMVERVVRSIIGTAPGKG